MKKSFVIPVLMLMVLAACNNGGKKPAAATIKENAKIAAVETPKAPEFIPFDVVERSFTVKDYANWRPLFNSDSTARKESGMELIIVGRGIEQNNDLAAFLQVSDVQKAKAYFADPRLKPLMEKAGILSKPHTEFFHVIRFNPNAKEKQWVTITHQVKDFDSWVKVFDAEGPVTRASYGLEDVVLAQGIDDPNLVFIVFDIKDLVKAKARIGDQALRNLMMDAGVVGAPKIGFYADGE